MEIPNSIMEKPEQAALRQAFDTLRATGRGKHVGPFSYYHIEIAQPLETVRLFLARVHDHFAGGPFDYNVIKLNPQSRVSFLRYEAFTTAFPALLASLSCDLVAQTARATDYTQRRNPPILHRKELLLPADNPLARAGVRLTARLEAAGAFANPLGIGTRDGWSRTLAELGLTINNGKVIG